MAVYDEDLRWYRWGVPEPVSQTSQGGVHHIITIGVNEGIDGTAGDEIVLFQIPEANQIVGGFVKILTAFDAVVTIDVVVAVKGAAAATGVTILGGTIDPDAAANITPITGAKHTPKAARSFPRQEVRLVFGGAALDGASGKLELFLELSENIAAAA